MALTTCISSFMGTEKINTIYLILLAIHTMLIAIYEKIGEKDKNEI